MPGSILKEMYEKHLNMIDNKYQKEKVNKIYSLKRTLRHLLTEWSERTYTKESKYLQNIDPNLSCFVDYTYRPNELYIIITAYPRNGHKLFNKGDLNKLKTELKNRDYTSLGLGESYIKTISVYDTLSENKIFDLINTLKIEEKIIEEKHKERLNQLNLWYEREKAKIIDQFKITDFKLEE